MSLRDLMQSHASTVFLNTDHFGEEVTHISRGTETVIVAVVDIDPPERNMQDGDARVYRPKIEVAESVDVQRLDTWKIRGLDYQTEKILPPDGTGMRQIELTRRDPLMSKGGRGG